MARVKLDFGAELDVLTQNELDESLKKSNDAQVSAYLRGLKWMRQAVNLPSVPTTYTFEGPNNGYAWDVKQITGTLTGGPESVAAYVGGNANARLIGYWAPQSSATAPNQNVFVMDFSSHQVILKPTETVYIATSGAFRFTQVMISAVEVPAEMVGKILS